MCQPQSLAGGLKRRTRGHVHGCGLECLSACSGTAVQPLESLNAKRPQELRLAGRASSPPPMCTLPMGQRGPDLTHLGRTPLCCSTLSAPLPACCQGLLLPATHPLAAIQQNMGCLCWPTWYPATMSYRPPWMPQQQLCQTHCCRCFFKSRASLPVAWQQVHIGLTA